MIIQRHILRNWLEFLRGTGTFIYIYRERIHYALPLSSLRTSVHLDKFLYLGISIKGFFMRHSANACACLGTFIDLSHYKLLKQRVHSRIH